MNDNNMPNVLAAFEILLEEIEAEVDLVNKTGAHAFAAGDHERARTALDRARQITAFRDKVALLRTEWEHLAPERQVGQLMADVGRPYAGRLRKGLRTREAAFYRPILQALDELGGSANIRRVLARVEELMRAQLSPVDYEPLNSDPDTPRWFNTAQWARNAMVKQGLLKSDSPRGLWELSEAGRHALHSPELF
ncbi:winged helix-turn-helix domain-containing protein [Kallotenue papyrolyticum]|uniref:winged helix-turn-helix domain-containing protein n=1 Tax=Kallotenue papyrolyticum TaxID=1325125 RepID=UPI0004786156|nr:winged helix-turn-helix domain-containing protein [Kallotenue papyrolyticum]